MTAVENPTGSNSKPAVKIEPSTQQVSVRHIIGVDCWFIPNEKLDGARKEFRAGILRNVTLDPKAKVMKDVWCGTGNVSEAEAVGELTTDTYEMPKDAIRTCTLTYDRELKVFRNKEKPAEIITEASYLLLLPNDVAKVGWTK